MLLWQQSFRNTPKPYLYCSSKTALKMYHRTTLFLALAFVLPVFTTSAQSQMAVVKKPLLFGLQDSTGKMLVEPLYSELLPQGKNAWIAGTVEGTGIINSKGEWLVKPLFKEIRQYKGDRVVAGKLVKTDPKKRRYDYNYNSEATNGDSIIRYGVADAQGNWIAEAQWSDVSIGPDGTMLVAQDRRTYGYLTKDGKELLPPQYNFGSFFIDDRAVVSSGGSLLNDYNYAWALYGVEGEAMRKNSYYGGKWEVIDRTGAKISKEQYDFLRDFHEGRAAFNRGGIWKRNSYDTDNMPKLIAGRWGFLDVNGNEIIPGQYDYVYDFDGGIAKVRQGERVFYINLEGKEVPAPAAKAKVKKTYPWPHVVAGSDYYGYINEKGEWLLAPVYVHAESFSDGFAAVVPKQKNDEHISVLPDWYNALYDTATAAESAVEDDYYNPRLPRFRNGRLRFTRSYHFDYLHTDTAALAHEPLGGYIDKSGKLVIPAQYDQAGPFSEGLAYVRVSRRWGVIDKTGKWIMPPVLEDPGVNDESNDDGGMEYNYQGRSMLSHPVSWSFNDLYRFSEGMGAIHKYGKYGFIDKTGKIIVAPIYDYVMPFSGGLAAVRIGTNWGFIDKTGKQVVPLKFHSVRPFSEGLAMVSAPVPQNVDNGDSYEEYRYGFIDTKGNWVVSPQYTSANSFSEGVASVSKEWSKWGFIDKTGKYVIAPKLSAAGSFSHGYARVIVAKKTANGLTASETVYIDHKGKTHLEFSDENPPQGSTVSPVKKDGSDRYGYKNAKGEWVIPAQYEEAGEFEKVE